MHVIIILSLERSKTENTPKFHEFHLIVANNVEVRLIDSVSAKWEKLAIHLHFLETDIERIRRDCHFQTEHCCRTVLTEWLEGKGRKPKTWDTVIQALKDAQLSEVARKLILVLSDHTDSGEAPQQHNESWFKRIVCTLL